MKKTLLFVFAFALTSLTITNTFAQNIGINATGDAPDASAMLDIDAQSKGLLIPRVSLTGLNAATPISTPTTSLLVYNTATAGVGTNAVTPGYYFWDGTAWVRFQTGTPPAGTEHNTLNAAYNQGGPGQGRIITADNGAVEINGTTATANGRALSISQSSNNAFGIGIVHSGTGPALGATATKTSNAYAVIEAETNSSTENNAAIFGSSIGASYGLKGQVAATASGKAGVNGINLRTSGGYGVIGLGYAGVVGQGTVSSLEGFGVHGSTTKGVGVQGETNDLSHSGIVGLNHGLISTGSGAGVMGEGNIGVKGQTTNGLGYGILGVNQSTSPTYNNIGVGGEGWVGVYGKSLDASGYGVYSDGNFAASGTKSFVIDHPSDPENKMLKHFCMESPEVLNLYRGNIVLDQNGEAIVSLPEYFESINTNFSYNLTPIGAAVNLFIKEKINNGQFKIAGGNPNMEVSWTVYAERNDVYLQKNPNAKAIEVEKRQKGQYIHPELYGQPEEKSMFPANKMQKTIKLKDENSANSGLKEDIKLKK